MRAHPVHPEEFSVGVGILSKMFHVKPPLHEVTDKPLQTLLESRYLANLMAPDYSGSLSTYL